VQGAEDSLVAGQERGVEKGPREGASPPAGDQAPGTGLVNIGPDTVFTVDWGVMPLQGDEEVGAFRSFQPGGFGREQR
jgi:hypothetical protein